MNRDIAEGKWKQLKGKAQEKWGDLTDDDCDRINGKEENFKGVMQEKYGKTKDEAQKAWESFKAKFD